MRHNGLEEASNRYCRYERIGRGDEELGGKASHQTVTMETE